MNLVIVLNVCIFFISVCESAPLVCDPGKECVTNCKLTNQTNVILPCPLGFYCEPNQLPIRCPKRYYCPSPTEQYECPEGHICPKKSWTPRGTFQHDDQLNQSECQHLSTCPSHSYRYTFYGAFIYIFVALFYLSFSHFVFITITTNGHAFPHFLSSPLYSFLSLFNIKSSKIKPLNSTKKEQEVEFIFEDLEVTIRPGNNVIARAMNGKKTILKGVAGHFKSGRVVFFHSILLKSIQLAAIMGPSGGGKSTLLSVLLGKLPYKGKLQVNGKIKDIKTLVGFVPQDDIMIPTLTVREVLMHSAMMRLSRTNAERVEIVNKVIKVLQLESIQNSIIGDNEKRGISGGEKKRVNIGIELVSGILTVNMCLINKEPRVLFLDEPTTGLDSSVSKDLMIHLKEIARSTGLTVIAVLHQPRYDIFSEVDDIVLLGRGGRTIFSGPTSNCYDYFSSIGYTCPEQMNPADFYLDVASGIVTNEINENAQLEDIFQAWENNKPEEILTLTKSSPPPKEPTSFFWQFLVCFKRAWIQNTRSVNSRILELVMHIFAGVVVGLGFFSTEIYMDPLPSYYLPFCSSSIRKSFCILPEVDNILRMSVYLCMSIGLVAVTIASKTFYNERLVFWRESSMGGNRLAYFLAKNLTDLEGMVLNSVGYASAFIFVASPSGHFSDYVTVIILYEYCLYGIGYICTWIPPYPTLLGVIVALVSGLGTGSSRSIKNMGNAGKILWARYFGESHYILELREEYIYPAYRENVRMVLDAQYTFNLDNFKHCLLAFVIIGTVLRLIAFIVMICTNRNKQK